MGMEKMENNFAKYITGMQHIGIPTNDIKKTKKFYEQLGFVTAYETVNQKANEKVAFLKLGNVVIETYENKQAALINGAIDHIALNVTEIEAVFNKVKDAGYQMVDEEIQFLPFWDNGVRFITIIGPNKEKVEFSQYL